MATTEATAGASAQAAGTAARSEAIVQAGEVRSTRIESLRGLAALGVVSSHAFGTVHTAAQFSTFPNRFAMTGGLGVNLFFALTGYLLFWPFVRQYFGRGGGARLGTYARNRALRILPLYYVVLAAFLITRHNGGTLDQWWRFGLFLENFSHQTITTVDGVMWSLVVEMQFYILLPLGAYLLAVAGRRRAALATGWVIALGVGFAALRWWIIRYHALGDPVWRYSLPANFVFFVPGLLLALLRAQWEERRPTWLRGTLARADVWLLASVPFWVIPAWRLQIIVDTEQYSAIAAFLVVGACVLPLRDGRLAGTLSWRPIALVGVASYSLYLWHMPITQELGKHIGGFVPLLAAALIVCLPLSALSYNLVEAPFLRMRRRWSSASATIR